MKKILRKLYRNQLGHYEDKLERTPRYAKTVGRRCEDILALRRTLTDEQKPLLEVLLKHSYDVNLVAAEHAFAEGFVFCTRLAKL